MSTITAAQNHLAADAEKAVTAPKPARTRKPAAAKVAPKVAAKPAPKPKAAPKVTGPTDRDAKRATASFAIKTAVAAFKALPVTKGMVTIDGTAYPKDVAWAALRQVYGYVPPSAWDTKLLGVRDVGRPVSAKKAA